MLKMMIDKKPISEPSEIGFLYYDVFDQETVLLYDTNHQLK